MTSGAELELRIRDRVTRSSVLAGAVGAIVVFVFLAFVLPAPEPKPPNSAIAVNLLVLVAYLLVTFVLGVRYGRRMASTQQAWLRKGRDPTEREVEDLLQLPLRTLAIPAASWGAAAVVFGLLNLTYSAELAERVAITVLLGGVTTCAIDYLLAELWMREITARALRVHTPAKPVTAGIVLRIMLAWLLATGVPLLGIVLLAVSVFVEGGTSAEDVAGSVLFLAVTALVAGAIAMFVAARSIADPIAAVRVALGRVERGDVDVDVPVFDGSEVGLLQAGFNRMVAGLRERERLRDLFGRHVGEEVAQAALDGGIALGGEEREIAVLFVDVVGSTALAQERSPVEVVALLNRFFSTVVEVVEAHGGWVNKFEGDAALCIFGAPDGRPDAATRALASARELHQRLERDGPLPAAIGVSAGRAVAGNIGATHRFEYTVIGDPVNEAARLTELAKAHDGRVLASAAALERASAEEEAHWRRDGEVVLRGRAAPTRLATPG